MLHSVYFRKFQVLLAIALLLTLQSCEEDKDDSHVKNDHMCNSYAEFKDMIQAEQKLLDVEGSVFHLKTPSPSPIHLNSSDTNSE